METVSALLAICAGNSPVPGEFPTQNPVTRSFDAFFDLRPNKRLSKQSWGWWFETPSRPLWRHRNDDISYNEAVAAVDCVATKQTAISFSLEKGINQTPVEPYFNDTFTGAKCVKKVLGVSVMLLRRC